MSSRAEEIRVEADRITQRLSTMPLNRLTETVAESVRSAAQRIVDLTSDAERPEDATIPSLAPTGLAAQISVVVYDYQQSTTATSEDAAVVEVLTELRRSLP